MHLKQYNYTKAISCIVCKTVFKSGDTIQAFLRSSDDISGSWTRPVQIDNAFFAHSKINKDRINRKHYTCKDD